MFNIEQVDILLETRIEELTEAQIEFLVENRLEFIKNSNKDSISRDHDPDSQKLTTDKIVDHIATKIDPTTKKSNTQWLVNRYKAGDFKLSDAKNVKKVLDSFTESKKHLEHQDIGEYKSVSHLKDALAPVQGKVEIDRENAKDKARQQNEEQSAALNVETHRHGMPIVFNENGHTGFKIPNRTRSIKNYGPAGKLAQTTWCTASNSKTNWFDHYTGDKYSLHLNDGNILQLHHQSNQLKDITNYQIDLKKDSRFSKHADVIKKFAAVTHELEGKPQSTLVDPIRADENEVDRKITEYERQRDALKDHLAVPNDTYAYRERRNSLSHHGRNYLNSLENSIKTANLTDEQFEKLSKFPAYNSEIWSVSSIKIKDHNLAENLAWSPHANPRHLEKIAKTISFGQDVSSNHNNSLKALIENPNHDIKSHHAVVDRILSDGNHDVATKYARASIGALPEHMDRLLHFGEQHMSHLALINDQFTPNDSYFDRLKDYPDAEATIVQHPKISANVAKHILDNTTDKIALTRLAGNHSVPFDIAKQAFMRGGGNVKKLIEHPNSTKEDVAEIIKHHVDSPNATKKSLDWLQSPRISKDLISHIVAHPIAHELLTEHGISLVDSLNLKPQHLESLIASPAFNSESKDHVGAILRSHALNSNVVNKLIGKTGITKDLADKLLSSDTNPEHVSSTALHSVLDSDDATLHSKHKALFHQSTQLSHFNKVKDDIRFHGAISNSKNAPPSILHSLATSLMDHVRYNVANNPNTEKRTHDILKTDQNPEIAKISAKKATK